MSKKAFLFFGIASLLLLCTTGCKNQQADMLIVNGVVHTMNDSSEIEQAIAIKDGKIVGIGTSEDLQFDFNYDTIIDLKGRSVFPGLIDSHCHFIDYAKKLDQVNLVGTRSFSEVLARLDTMPGKDEREWILGYGWDQNDWRKTNFPVKARLDSMFPEKPVLLMRIGGHAGLANSRALKLAGINRKTRIEGGVIRKSGGRPNGMLLDNALAPVLAVIPEMDKTTLNAQLLKAQEDCFQYGLTTLGEAGIEKQQIDMLGKLMNTDAIKLHIYAMLNPSEENKAHYFQTGPVRQQGLTITSFRIRADGALGSRGACLLRYYKDQPGRKGFLWHSTDEYETLAQEIFDAGFQMNTDCVGDSANRFFAKLYNRILQGDHTRRWRIEHAQVVHPEDLPKFADASIIPSIQPKHATSDMYWAKDRLGKERVKYAYAYRSLYSQNGILAYGSDFPVESPNPFMGFYAAVARQDLKGYPYGGFNIGEALTREMALKSMTKWAAYACFLEDRKGSLELGKDADFIILDRDLMFAPIEEIPETNVLMTVVNGEIVFSSSNP